MSTKERLSVSVDAEVLAAAKEAVADGDAVSLSAWVNEALWAKTGHQQRLKALGEAIRAYEDEYGEITDEEIAEANRRMRARTITVRGRPKGSRRRAGAA